LNLQALYSPRSRGMLLDLSIFALNLLAMRVLAGQFVSIVRDASAGDGTAKLAMGTYFLALFVLPVAGSMLKRWSFHQRRESSGSEERTFGCLLNPAFYLAVSLTVGTSAAVLFGERAFGPDFHDRGAVFLPMMAGVLVLSVVQTVMVYRYFSRPRSAPGRFWRSGRAAAIGDGCVFLNVILFQILWNIALSDRFERVQSLGDAAGRLFFLWFLSILVYFPPRIFYLAEDIDRPASWGTMALATSPLILRVMGII
jgi:hypothetical protein